MKLNRWAVVAVPLMSCLVLMEAVVRQVWADRAFRMAKDRIAKYERAYVLYLKGERERPMATSFWGRALEKAVRLEPHCAVYRNYLGRYYQALAADRSRTEAERMKLAAKAIQQHEKAVKLDPLNGVYLAHLAWMEGATGEGEQAVQNFEKAIKLNPSNLWIQDMYKAYRESIGLPEEDYEQSAGTRL